MPEIQEAELADRSRSGGGRSCCRMLFDFFSFNFPRYVTMETETKCRNDFKRAYNFYLFYNFNFVNEFMTWNPRTAELGRLRKPHLKGSFAFTTSVLRNGTKYHSPSITKKQSRLNLPWRFEYSYLFDIELFYSYIAMVLFVVYLAFAFLVWIVLWSDTLLRSLPDLLSGKHAVYENSLLSIPVRLLSWSFLPTFVIAQFFCLVVDAESILMQLPINH